MMTAAPASPDDPGEPIPLAAALDSYMLRTLEARLVAAFGSTPPFAVQITAYLLQLLPPGLIRHPDSREFRAAARSLFADRLGAPIMLTRGEVSRAVLALARVGLLQPSVHYQPHNARRGGR